MFCLISLEVMGIIGAIGSGYLKSVGTVTVMLPPPIHFLYLHGLTATLPCIRIALAISYLLSDDSTYL